MSDTNSPVYLDCSATAPIEPEIAEEVEHYLSAEFGNAGSRTHAFGARAKRRVQEAREQVAAVVAAESDEVVFTSGATEANNLALLGLADWAIESHRRHIVTTAIEHKAVLEPLAELARRGIEITHVPVGPGGRVDARELLAAVRDDTGVVSVMQVNNETGVRQPLDDIADGLADHLAYLHVDAAQGFGREIEALREPRIDLISLSGHKAYGPKGVGALVTRRRRHRRVPLRPLMFGGGQERGLRPGTLPVALIAGLGAASQIALRDAGSRARANTAFRDRALAALSPLKPQRNGDPHCAVPYILNLSLPGIDAEALVVALKGHAAVAVGAACTSASYEVSHVLTAMGLPDERVAGAVRLSWCHMTEEPDWRAIVDAARRLAPRPAGA